MDNNNTPTPTNRVHHHPYNGGGGGREDCWSEGATGTLIDAWGDRYLQLSRGNLRQKDWKDVSDAVNARQDAVNKPRKTDVQCKNRIDTIKKKYKLERSKPGPSKWPFYAHLDELIGANVTPKQPPPPLPLLLPPPPPVAFTVKTYKQHKLNPSPNRNHNPIAAMYSAGSSSKSRVNSPGSSGSSHGDDDDDDDDEANLMLAGGNGNGTGSGGGGGGGSSSRRRKKNGVVEDLGDGMAFRELARAIVKFGEVYERIENSKQQQMIELEKQRMQFTKELEYQRMQMFMEAQLKLEKTKRPKHAPSNGKKL